ncbi:hypothetical protein Rhopal_002119-T1 [Rhodotorula paludigena]|uniref:Uncharacterized protein n=1 Tax=Rhodotorula paludigena TaxID=86838 RepID=A0AAV5GI29_9BASI|nr:hypothetical protein Rhopal_002119-T1 [Rhodotorula paludigena]
MAKREAVELEEEGMIDPKLESALNNDACLPFVPLLSRNSPTLDPTSAAGAAIASAYDACPTPEDAFRTLKQVGAVLVNAVQTAAQHAELAARSLLLLHRFAVDLPQAQRSQWEEVVAPISTNGKAHAELGNDGLDEEEQVVEAELAAALSWEQKARKEEAEYDKLVDQIGAIIKKYTPWNTLDEVPLGPVRWSASVSFLRAVLSLFLFICQLRYTKAGHVKRWHFEISHELVIERLREVCDGARGGSDGVEGKRPWTRDSLYAELKRLKVLYSDWKDWTAASASRTHAGSNGYGANLNTAPAALTSNATTSRSRAVPHPPAPPVLRPPPLGTQSLYKGADGGSRRLPKRKPQSLRQQPDDLGKGAFVGDDADEQLQSSQSSEAEEEEESRHKRPRLSSTPEREEEDVMELQDSESGNARTPVQSGGDEAAQYTDKDPRSKFAARAHLGIVSLGLGVIGAREDVAGATSAEEDESPRRFDRSGKRRALSLDMLDSDQADQPAAVSYSELGIGSLPCRKTLVSPLEYRDGDEKTPIDPAPLLQDLDYLMSSHPSNLSLARIDTEALPLSDKERAAVGLPPRADEQHVLEQLSSSQLVELFLCAQEHHALEGGRCKDAAVALLSVIREYIHEQRAMLDLLRAANIPRPVVSRTGDVLQPAVAMPCHEGHKPEQQRQQQRVAMRTPRDDVEAPVAQVLERGSVELREAGAGPSSAGDDKAAGAAPRAVAAGEANVQVKNLPTAAKDQRVSPAIAPAAKVKPGAGRKPQAAAKPFSPLPSTSHGRSAVAKPFKAHKAVAPAPAPPQAAPSPALGPAPPAAVLATADEALDPALAVQAPVFSGVKPIDAPLLHALGGLFRSSLLAKRVGSLTEAGHERRMDRWLVDNADLPEEDRPAEPRFQPKSLEEPLKQLMHSIDTLPQVSEWESMAPLAPLTDGADEVIDTVLGRLVQNVANGEFGSEVRASWIKMEARLRRHLGNRRGKAALLFREA